MISTLRGLSCLYYPFSRLLDEATLKYLLLIFDSVTFLDDLGNSDWRKVQLQLMAREDDLFSEFDHLSDDYDMLVETQAVQIINPKTLKSSNSSEVALATLADLSDPNFVELASKPSHFGLPSRPLGRYRLSPEDRPTWQIFSGKIANPLLKDDKFLSDDTWASHILVPGDRSRHWTLSYEAGSAATVNMYLEAAQELRLTPVTTSELHHQLVLHKLKRIFQENGNKVELIDDASRKRYQAVFGQGEVIRLFGDLFPLAQIDKVPLEKILRFRHETQGLRRGFVSDIDGALRIIDQDPMKASYDKDIIEVIGKLKTDFKKFESELTGIRDKILPAFGKALMYGSAGGGALGTLVSFLGGLSSAGVVAASTLTVTGAFLAEAMQLWIERQKVLREQSPSVSYLARVSRLIT